MRSSPDLRALARLPEPAGRTLAVGERLGRFGPDAFAGAFDRLARGAARGGMEEFSRSSHA